MDHVNKAPPANVCRPVWSTAQKSCVGTALNSANLWFTTGRGIVTEVFYPRIDIPQVRDLGFIIADGQGFWVELKALPEPPLQLDDHQVPLPIIHHHHDRFDFTLTVCADPNRDVLLVDFKLEGDESLQPYLICAARLGEDAQANQAWVGNWEGRKMLWAEQGPFGLALACRDAEGYPALGCCSVGEVGVSDLWQDFDHHGRMAWAYTQAGPGEVGLGAELPRTGTVALSLGSSKEAAATNAWSALASDFEIHATAYRAAWQAWHKTHHLPKAFASRLPKAAQELYVRSSNVLKVHEDRTFPGALVASLSVPWGEASDSRGGYHLVWSRDLVESAGALIVTGAVDEARKVLTYLISTQQADGHWLQNQWLGGKAFWQGIQLDETAFPVLLTSLLRQYKSLKGIAVDDMVRRALQFIIHVGPATSQDRWEEDGGINAFTLAVAIAALVEGAAMLEGKAADCALMVADYWNSRLEDWTFVRDTDLARQHEVPGYFVRISPEDELEKDGDDNEWIPIKNRAQDPHLPASEQVATDFLQLVRYGLRRADDPHITASVKVMDALLKTETPSGPVWHRYNGDGYGEHADGSPFDGHGIGRGWPLLVGERGHYALSNGEDALPYIESMVAMTGKGGLLPEQIWDTDPIPEKSLEPGLPSGSAMPLVWAHGEFIKLCHSLIQGKPVDRPEQTWKRYQGEKPKLNYQLWQLHQRPRQLRVGEELRILMPEPFTLHWGVNGWKNVQEVNSDDWTFGHVVVLPFPEQNAPNSVEFTIRWRDSGDWQGENFHIALIGSKS